MSTMQRIPAHNRIDPRLVSLLKNLAIARSISFSQLIEHAVIEFLRVQGVLPDGFEPLGEQRGGARRGAGAKTK